LDASAPPLVILSAAARNACGRAAGFRLFGVGNLAGVATVPERQVTRRVVEEEARSRPRAPGILVGIGLGGFVDGIVLHQILQWHHLLSSEAAYPKTTVRGLEDNTLADGLFHAATWVAVAVGIWLLWRRTTKWRWAISGQAFFGWMLVGWGIFNLVEGLVDHQILGLHHVARVQVIGRPMISGSWPLAFF
jgi:uncharacterized membrane protein